MYLSNFKRYWKEHAVHFAVGAVAGLLLVKGQALAGLTLMGTVWKRQDLEFQKRADTPGIDLAYHIGGLLAGIALGVGIIRWSRRLIRAYRETA